jgi:hypothetical protein
MFFRLKRQLSPTELKYSAAGLITQVSELFLLQVNFFVHITTTHAHACKTKKPFIYIILSLRAAIGVRGADPSIKFQFPLWLNHLWRQLKF